MSTAPARLSRLLWICLLSLPLPSRADGPAEAGTGGLLVVASAASPLESVERKELFDLYTGRRAGLASQQQTQAIEQARGSEARHHFYAALGWGTPAQIDSHWARLQFSGRLRPPPQAQDDRDLVRRLKADPSAIGYMWEQPKDSGLKVLLRLPRRPPLSP